MIIDSKNIKILITSDVHHQVEKLNKIIQHESADINIVLGDWWDSHYYDTIDDAKKTTDYLMRFLSTHHNKTVYGNHDAPYLSFNPFTICSGFHIKKLEAINSIFGSDKNSIIQKFEWFFWIDDFLCSHAGLHSSHIDPHAKTNSQIDEMLNKEKEKANIKLFTNDQHWFYMAGRARGGSYPKGGLNWLDFDCEFAPIKGLNQIVGHTFRKGNKINRYAKTENYCIDTNLNEWLTITNKQLEIKSFKDL